VSRRPMRRGRAGIRWALTASATVLLAALVTVPTSAGAIVAANGGNAPKCPTNWYCTSIPCPQGPCPEVQVGPDVDVGQNQWLYVNLYHFPANGADEAVIYYCSDQTSLPAPPLCFTPATPQGVPPSAVLSHEPVTVQPFSNGTSSLSFQVAEVGTLDPPLWGQHIISGGFDPNEKSFFCDGTQANPCSIEVSDAADFGQAPSVDNTAVIPIEFAPSSSGCPQAAEVNTESEFGIDQLLPEAARLSCLGQNPAIAVNTAEDGWNAVNQAAQGNVQVGFTDDPEASDQQAQINGNLSLIPIALSANVIGVKAVMLHNGVGYPQQSWDLTPNMVAGLISFNYSAFDSADLVPCPPQNCRLPCESKTAPCSLLMQLNVIPIKGSKIPFLDEQSYGTYVRSDQSGVTHSVFQWLCAAPNQPVTIPYTGQTVAESMTGEQELMTGLKAYGYKGTTCPSGADQFPKLTISQTTQWSADAQPNQQANKLDGATGYVPPPGFSDSQVAGFATMNWAESEYYGLSTANLQNAAGAFVAPSATSLDAALADAKVNPDGSYVFNYDDTSDPNAYPLPDLIYAAVPTAPMPAGQATQVTDLLDQILNLTGGTESADLPQGFVPLPSSVYQQALKDVTADVHVQPATTPTTTPTTSTPSAVTSYPPSSGAPQTFVAPRTVTVQGTRTVIPTTKAGPVAAKGAASGPVPPPFALASSSTRLFVPLAMVVAPILLLLGLLLLLSEPARRRTAQAAGKVGRGVGSAGTAVSSGAHSVRHWFGSGGP